MHPPPFSQRLTTLVDFEPTRGNCSLRPGMDLRTYHNTPADGRLLPMAVRAGLRYNPISFPLLFSIFTHLNACLRFPRFIKFFSNFVWEILV